MSYKSRVQNNFIVLVLSVPSCSYENYLQCIYHFAGYDSRVRKCYIKWSLFMQSQCLPNPKVYTFDSFNT